jgi:hypothetical protein
VAGKKNQEQSLKSFGASFQNVVKENLYTTDIEAMKKYNNSRKYFTKTTFPQRCGYKLRDYICLKLN